MAGTTPPASVTGPQPSTPVATMKAVVQHRYGPPDVLAVEETGVPALGDDEVLIRVRAAGLNVAGDFVTRGVPYFLRLLAGCGGRDMASGGGRGGHGHRNRLEGHRPPSRR